MRILIIDDDKNICEALKRLVISLGHGVECAHKLAAGVDKVYQNRPDLVFLDVRLPDGNGLAAIERIKKAPGSPEVIIITGEGDPDGAEAAIRAGAWDYIEKPLRVESIQLPLLRVLQYRAVKSGPKRPVVLKREGIIGSSPELNRVLEDLARAADMETSILLTGETGTGKELFARKIHENSRRADYPFVIVDCAALPDSLVESTLFGHEKGAYTGADSSREGMIKQADRGTLFLDEVGELPLSVQGAFLRVLQERRFRPIGSKKEISSDFRLISATNRSLPEMAQQNRFRPDLLFRLQAMVIDLPPLRKRSGDSKEIAFHYIQRFCRQYGLGTKGFSPEFIEALDAYDWPGNVRELRHTLEVVMSNARHEDILYPFHLPVTIRSRLARKSVRSERPAPSPEGPSQLQNLSSFNYRAYIEYHEKIYFQDLFRRTNGDTKEICRLSGLSRAQVYRLLKKHGVELKVEE